MKRRGQLALLGLGCLALASGGCTRANLDAITRVPPVDGSSGGDGAVTGGSDSAAIDGGDSAAIGGGDSAATSGGDSATAVTCPSPALPAADTTKTIQVGTTSRSYLLHVPSAYDGSKPVPLVLDFHYLASSGTIERTISPYPAQIDPEGAVMAFPNGLSGPSGAAWNFGPCCVAGVDDVAFVRALVTDVEKVACIDPKRVYAVATSMGGGMAYYLACHAADVFAAVAPSAWDLLQENVGDCQPSRSIAVISFRDTTDTLVPYAGGVSSVVPKMSITFLGAQATFQKWAQIDQCTGSPSVEDANGCSTYAKCQGGVEVVLCTKQSGNQDTGSPSIAWPFLKQHPLP